MTLCLHLTHTQPDKDSRILKEMIALDDKGFDVHAVGILARASEGTKGNIPKSLHFTNINLNTRNLRFLPKRFRHLLSLFEVTIKLLFVLIKFRPEVIHCHGYRLLPFALLTKSISHAKLVYDAHELESLANNISSAYGKLIRLIESLAWRYIDALIVVSPSIKTWYLDAMGEKKSEIILNSPYFSPLSGAPSNYLRDLYKISQDELIFIYVGFLTNGRGLECIVDAFSSPEVRSHVVFMGYGPLYESLKSVSEKHERIHMHPAVSHAEVVPVVSSASYGLCLIENVSLSDYYCLPNKLFEYCFGGVPVIASDFPEIQKLVENYNLGICTKPTRESLSETIRYVEANDINFLPTNLEELSWESQVGKLQRLYSELVDAPIQL